MGPLLFARRGCGGSGTDSLRRAGAGSSCAEVAAADGFLDGFAGRLGKPPVDRGTLRGEVDEIRDRVSEVSVCAGETSRDAIIGGSSTGTGGDGAFCTGASFSTTLFRGFAFRMASFGGGDFDSVGAGLGVCLIGASFTGFLVVGGLGLEAVSRGGGII
jgi:hypothetical protein